LQKNLDSFEQSDTEKENECNRLRDTVQLLEQEVNNLAQQMQNLQHQNNSVNVELENQVADKKNLQQETESLQRKLTAADKRMQSNLKEGEISKELQKDLVETKQELNQLVTVKKQLEQEINLAREIAREAEKEKLVLQEIVKTEKAKNTELESLKRSQDQLRESNRVTATNMQKLEVEVRTLQTQLASVKEEKKKIELELQKFKSDQKVTTIDAQRNPKGSTTTQNNTIAVKSSVVRDPKSPSDLGKTSNGTVVVSTGESKVQPNTSISTKVQLNSTTSKETKPTFPVQVPVPSKASRPFGSFTTLPGKVTTQPVPKVPNKTSKFPTKVIAPPPQKAAINAQKALNSPKLTSPTNSPKIDLKSRLNLFEGKQ